MYLKLREIATYFNNYFNEITKRLRDLTSKNGAHLMTHLWMLFKNMKIIQS